MTTDDAKSLFQSLRDAGIRPSKDLRDALTNAGFDFESLLQMAGMMPNAQPPQFKETALTSDQKSQIQSILSKYDAKNMTAEDAKSLFEDLRDAGIPPSKELEDTITAAGFDFKSLLESSGIGRHPRHHNMQGNNGSINTSALQTLQSILSQYDLSNLSSTQQNEIVTKLQEAGLLMGSGNMIDLSA
jgi:hypothetical protein